MTNEPLFVLDIVWVVLAIAGCAGTKFAPPRSQTAWFVMGGIAAIAAIVIMLILHPIAHWVWGTLVVALIVVVAYAIIMWLPTPKHSR